MSHENQTMTKIFYNIQTVWNLSFKARLNCFSFHWKLMVWSLDGLVNWSFTASSDPSLTLDQFYLSCLDSCCISKYEIYWELSMFPLTEFNLSYLSEQFSKYESYIENWSLSFHTLHWIYSILYIWAVIAARNMNYIENCLYSPSLNSMYLARLSSCWNVRAILRTAVSLPADRWNGHLTRRPFLKPHWRNINISTMHWMNLSIEPG